MATINNLLQVLAEPAMRGRVMSLNGMALNGAAPLGAILAGALAQKASVPAAVGSMAGCGLVLTLIFVARLRIGEATGRENIY